MEQPSLPIVSDPDVAYTFLRYVGLILDALSSEGLEIWQDERQRWCWRWRTTGLRSERSFWALGEALVDAVVARYPLAFDGRLVGNTDER
jgi:hypothetical protein